QLETRRFLELSYGERRLVLFARALASRPALLLLDETLTGLDAVNAARLRRWLGAPPRRLSWVLATHRHEDIPPTATHLLLLERGAVVGRARFGSAAARRLLLRWQRPRQRAHARARRNAGAIHGARAAGAASARGGGDRLLLQVKRGALWLGGRRVLRDIDWSLRRGECQVLAGVNGAGKSAWVRALYGDLPFALGSEVLRIGVAPGEPLHRFRERCGYLSAHLQTEYPRDASVLDTVLSGLQASHGLRARPTREQYRAARRELRRWGLLAYASRPLATLSYGEVRRVLLARAWIGAPCVLLLDEPFAGLDPAQRRFLATEIERLRRAGAGIVITLHPGEPCPVRATHRFTIGAGRLHSRPER
ncbi:MAG: ATP-binding cassette domain-containing protein, partial [Gammaproteobacteria bacterium]|nr:ATP-binding cassette domain-containing protein [Gammaproteobacteria bacterium]